MLLFNSQLRTIGLRRNTMQRNLVDAMSCRRHFRLAGKDQSMPVIERIQAYADELTAIRHDIHAHPELGFEEVRTSGLVAEKLISWGIEAHRGIGKTGVVGVLKGKAGNGRSV